MNKDQLFPLIFGLVLGVLLMFFWNLGASLNNQNLRLGQLSQIVNENSQRIEQIVNFIQTPATSEGEVMQQEEAPMIIE